MYKVAFLNWHREEVGRYRTPNALTNQLPRSAFGGKADVNSNPPQCPLIARSGHSDEDLNSEILQKQEENMRHLGVIAQTSKYRFLILWVFVLNGFLNRIRDISF